MRRPAATAMISLGVACLVACAPGLAERKPLDQQPIGTGVLGGPSATLPTTAAAPSTTERAAPSAASSDPTPSSSASDDPKSGPSKVADLCPPKGQKPDLSRFGGKTSCKQPKPRSQQLADLRGNEQLLASMQPTSPERDELVFRLAQGYAFLECTLAAACVKSRDSAATSEDISLAEAKKKTDEYCSALKSTKRRCP